MRKRSLFAMSLISLALVACSNDEEINKVIDQENEGGALVTLKLDVAKPQTKGSPDATNQQAGKTEENTISNVTVVVDYGTEQKYFKDSDAFESGQGWIPAEKEFSFKAPEGDATFYVFANVNSADQIENSWKTDMVSAGTVSEYYTDSKFFMSNQDGKGVQHTISAVSKNEVKVNIERAAAKVTVESKADFTDNTHGGNLRDMSFTLGNMVDKFHLLQQSNYAIPTGLTYLPTNDVAATNDWKNVTLGQTANGQGTVQATALAGAYCMENISADNNQNTTTYAKFKTTFVPGKALDFDVADGGDGLKIKNDLKTVTVGDTDLAPSFYVVLEGDRENVTSNYILKSDLYQADGTTLKDGVKLSPTNGGYDVTGIDGISKISAEYENGQCYFGPIWFNIDASKVASPVYRNDWYHLTVKSIKLPGSPQEPGDGGEEPLVSDADVTVEVTVQAWEWEPRDIELQ
jgi:hypothetical protein